MAKIEKLEDLPEPEQSWTRKILPLVKGKKIIGCRYLSEEEAENMGWTRRSLALFLEDGTVLYPSSDDEGNDAGALFTTDEELPVIPVI